MRSEATSKRPGRTALARFLALAGLLGILIWTGDHPIGFVLEIAREPSAPSVLAVPAVRLDVTPQLRVDRTFGGRSFVEASYTFDVGGTLRSGTRVFPSRDRALTMSQSSATDLASTILADGKVRIPHNDPSQAFLVYRSSTSWLKELALQGMLLLVAAYLALSGIKHARIAIRDRQHER